MPVAAKLTPLCAQTRRISDLGAADPCQLQLDKGTTSQSLPSSRPTDQAHLRLAALLIHGSCNLTKRTTYVPPTDHSYPPLCRCLSFPTAADLPRFEKQWAGHRMPNLLLFIRTIWIGAVSWTSALLPCASGTCNRPAVGLRTQKYNHDVRTNPELGWRLGLALAPGPLWP
jgi:hypothetical protein